MIDKGETEVGREQSAIARREALLKVIKTTGYAAPVAMLLLSSTRDAKAGAVPSGTT